ncbi:MAG: lipid A deacylase LpxR family protein [Imperialibacter sp.]|uniref:lipid A deacylase LpxR family protein n=1 Tax=Imperialibacter sp. TaxID=2038411 RepID=UPI0032EEDFBA
MARKINFLLCLVFGFQGWPWGFNAIAESDPDSTFLRQVQLTVDNDAYFFTSYDRYYSSGVFASYSSLKSRLPFSRPKEGSIYSSEVVFSHYIYTPKNILWDKLEQLDRPYAGMATLGVQLNYLRPSSAFTMKADVGWLGPAIQTAELMRWWHGSLGIRLPRGWDYQINNTPVLMLTPSYLKQWAISEKLDVVSSTSMSVGTVLDQVSQEVTLRYGLPGSLNKSHLTNSLLNAAKGSGKLIEWYLVASWQGSYVLYNATIDGNFIGPESMYHERSEKAVLRQTYGAVLAYKKADFELSFKTTSREVKGAENHRYMRAKISYRF